MAGVNGNESYYDKDVVIEFKKSHSEFNITEPGKHLNQDIIENGEIKLLNMDEIYYKVELATYNRQKIVVEHCKTLSDKEVDPPDEEHVKGLMRLFAEDKTINIWLNSAFDPMYTSSTNGGRLLDMKYWEEADRLNIKDLVKNSVEKDFEIANVAIVSSSGSLYYIRDNDGMAKLFVPFMMEWFEEKFPGLTVDDSHKNCAKISKLGFRMLLQMYIFSTFGWLNTAPVTFQLGSEFSVSIPALIESSLSGGIALGDNQLKQLAHMLPVRAKISTKDSPFFSDKIITDPKNIDVSFTEHAECTWYTFISAMEMFPTGCTIHLAPSQIIVDDDDHEVFSEYDVASLIYHGPNFVLPDKQNTLDIVVCGNSIDNSLRTRMVKYFDKFFDLSISAWRIEGKRV